jgi:predicted MFS family arabinose efflux permease
MGPAYPDAVEVRTALWRLPAMRSLVGVTVLGFTGYWLTLASLPAYAVAGGAAESTAGVVTAVFLVVTVAVQAAVPALTRRFGAGPVLIAGLLALGLPAPLYAVSNGLAWLSWISAIRGAGFGVLTVLGSVLAVQAAPEARRGEAVGLYGLAIAVPNLLAVPAGVALVLDGHSTLLAWLALAPVLALPMVPALVRAAASAEPPHPARGAGRRAALAALAPSLVLLVVTLAGGGLVTFLPIERPDGALATAALLLFGVTGALARWRAGALADRTGGGGLMPASLVVAAVGLVAVAAGLHSADAAVLIGAAVFGLGYGSAQNLTLLAAFSRAGADGATAASAVWNAAFDAGTALGALALGGVAAGIGLPWTYVAVAVVLALTVPLAVAARPPVASGRPSPAASG